jgi:hypothetical protein
MLLYYFKLVDGRIVSDYGVHNFRTTRPRSWKRSSSRAQCVRAVRNSSDRTTPSRSRPKAEAPFASFLLRYPSKHRVAVEDGGPAGGAVPVAWLMIETAASPRRLRLVGAHAELFATAAWWPMESCRV